MADLGIAFKEAEMKTTGIGPRQLRGAGLVRAGKLHDPGTADDDGTRRRIFRVETVRPGTVTVEVDREALHSATPEELRRALIERDELVRAASR